MSTIFVPTVILSVSIFIPGVAAYGDKSTVPSAIFGGIVAIFVCFCVIRILVLRRRRAISMSIPREEPRTINFPNNSNRPVATIRVVYEDVEAQQVRALAPAPAPVLPDAPPSYDAATPSIPPPAYTGTESYPLSPVLIER
ncbi:hypothetical protein ONZ45_g10016 [Pleurotus djamor]|nr:hypothetical protein ONZ45_g10016 [Pleurotus djamor]